jgi:uncharacterized protein YjiS (DUF1127 family)
MRRQLKGTPMTYVRSIPSDLDDTAFQLPRYRALKPVDLPLVNRGPLLGRDATQLLAHGARAVLHYARQRSEARRARRELLELDDRLLRDVGLSRADVRSSNIMTKGEPR